MASPGHGGRAAPAMVLLVWLIASAPLCAGGRTIGTAEHVAGVQPWHELVARAIASGRLPEWDDASGLGAPLAGDPARPALYPPVWLGGIAPGPLATDALLLLHLLLFGLGVAAWSRRLGAEPVAAAAAGAAALLSGTTLGLLASGGPLYAAAWLPWIGWAAHGIAAQPARGGIGLAAAGGALLLAGPSAPAIAAPLVALAALAARAPRRAGPYLTALAAIAGAFLLAAFALVPAGALGRLAPPPQPAPPLAPTDLAALALAAWAALRPGAGLPARLLLAAGAAAALVALGLNLAPAGFLAAATALVWAVAGAGLSDVLVRLAGRRGAAVGRPRLRAALGALLLAAVVGAPLARAWRALPLAPRAELDAPPAILSGLAAPAPGEPRPRLAWPDPAGRPYGDAPPDTGARFGLAHLPPRDRARDPELAALWRAASGAGERLLDLYGVAYLLVPASVAAPADLPVLGRTGRGDRVLAENRHRRPRAFVAPRWSWHASDEELARDLFPLAPDRRASVALGAVRLSGTGRAAPARAPGAAPQPSPPCQVRAPAPEHVTLSCSSSTGGYAVLLDRVAPGWTAELDGRPARIERADLLARAVAVPPGDHEIRFRYRTPGLRLGGLVSLLAWLNLALAAIVIARRGRS